MICLNDLFVEDLRTVAFNMLFGKDGRWIEIAASKNEQYIGDYWAICPLDESRTFTAGRPGVVFASLFEMEGRPFCLYSVGDEPRPSERPLGI